MVTTAKLEKVTVLGAGGFLGSAITRRLHEIGHQVLACYHHSPLEQHPWQTKTGDLGDKLYLAEIFSSSDVLFYFCTNTNPSTNPNSLSKEYEQTVLPLTRVIELARFWGVKKIVFPSSGGTIYAPNTRPCTEISSLLPMIPYAQSKVAAERLLEYSHRAYGISATILRIGNPYGPRQSAKPGQGVIAHWVKSIHQQKPIQILGDPGNKRDFIYIDDFTELAILAAFESSGIEIFNIGTGYATSLLEILDTLCELSDREIETTVEKARPFDRPSISLDPSKILSLAPNFKFKTLKEGLTLTYNSMAEIE